MFSNCVAAFNEGFYGKLLTKERRRFGKVKSKRRDRFASRKRSLPNPDWALMDKQICATFHGTELGRMLNLHKDEHKKFLLAVARGCFRASRYNLDQQSCPEQRQYMCVYKCMQVEAEIEIGDFKHLLLFRQWNPDEDATDPTLAASLATYGQDFLEMLVTVE